MEFPDAEPVRLPDPAARGRLSPPPVGPVRAAARRARAGVSALWSRHGALPAAPFVLWPLAGVARGEARAEHALLALAALALAVGNPRVQRLARAVYPILVVGILYDALRLSHHIWPVGRVHLCDLRQAEVRLFGVTVGGARTTMHDWLQARATPVLDALCAVPYGTFALAWLALAAVLYRRSEARLRRFAWSFLVMNLFAFGTYALYPAAPPWYYHAHGCAVDLAARASEGPNLARVDAMLGVPLFRAFYARSAEVFGAVPSLHVAHAVLVCVAGWACLGRAARALTALYAVAMAFAAVYLDHHWVLDVVLGALCAAVAHVAVSATAGARARRAWAGAARP